MSDCKDQFVVQGQYYTGQWGDDYDCRRVLEIFSKTTKRVGKPDAVIIMMNPGSSRPLAGESDVGRGMVRAVPDMTQSRIMALMNRRGWNWIRVINLSDLRNPKSCAFAEAVKRFANTKHQDKHSVFAQASRDDLSKLLQRSEGAPVIVAWGCMDALEPLARMAMEALKKIGDPPLIGRRGARGDWRYWHPLLRGKKRQDAWLESICCQLDGDILNSGLS